MGRRLAAIMFNDIVGYTALMQADEVLAKKKRDRHRTVLHQALNSWNGDIIQHYGDGTLCIFQSALEAVNCAIEIQQQLVQPPEVPLRIGIHTGDIVRDEEGIYGDGVNLASRIESMATSGSVLISGKVHDEIKNHREVSSRPLGEFELKNVSKPVELYAIANDRIRVPKGAELQGKGLERIKSIAVMPFVNMSTDPENEYFSDGITEELINALAQVEGLRVTSRTSSFAFKGKHTDIREIGKQLNVRTILEGSVRKAGNKVRITAQLIKSSDGYHLWSETYDRDLEDIFAVQDEISRKIANQLREKLTVKENRESIVKPATNSIEAYNLYLRGLYHYNKWTPANARQAISFYEQAIKSSPEFSLPYSGLASSYTLLGTTANMSPVKAFGLVTENAKKAIELDRSSVDAHCALSIVQFFFEWNWEEAMKHVKDALALNPNDPNALLLFGLYYTIKCDFDKALEVMTQALNTDPLSVVLNRTMADVQYLAENYEEALDYYDQVLILDPSFRAAHEFRAWTYLQMQDFEKAIAIFQDLGEEITHALRQETQIGYAYALWGNMEDAQRYLDKLLNRKDPKAMDLAVIYTGMGDADKAFHYLEECLEQRIGTLVFLNSSPIWKPLRNDARFNIILKKIGLEPRKD